MNKKIIKKSFENIPIVKKGDYLYVIHPLTDGVPFIKPDLLEEVVNEMYKRASKKQPFNRIVTIEAMGIPFATSLSIKTGIPFTIIRKRSYGLPDEISVEQVTGYSKSKLYINGLKKGDKIIIVDDVLSTGGTLRAILSVFKKIGITVKGVYIAVNKGEELNKIKKEYNIDIDVIVDIEVKNNKVIIKNL